MDHILLHVLLKISSWTTPSSECIDEERRRVQYDCNAKNIITSSLISLSMDEFFRISEFKKAKEMWDVLDTQI